MAGWILVPCLVKLRDEFNQLSPNRDKGADGSIGDVAHQQESSDHNPDETGRTPFEDADNINEVHALDIDSTGPWPAGHDLDHSIEIIRLRHQRGEDNRLQNIIWRDRVASRNWGWTWDPRPGIGHFDHGHFSARYTTAQESDISPWGILEDPVTPAEMDSVADRVLAKMTDAMLTPNDGYGFQARRIAWAYPITATRSTLSTLEAVFALLQQVLSKVTADDNEAQRIIDAVHAEAADLAARVDQVDESVMAKLSDPATPDAQVALALNQLLGERKAAVLALM